MAILQHPVSALLATSREDLNAGERWLRSLLVVGRVLLIPGRVVLVVVAILLLRLLQNDEAPLLTMILLPIALLGLLATFARSLKDIKVWGLYVGAFMGFVHLRTLADETGVPVSVHYPIDIDQALFLGAIPTAWLQERFYSPGVVGPLEILALVVYASYFFGAHVVAIAVWRLRPAIFTRVLKAIVLTFYAGLVVYFLIPTAPPWLAHELGAAPEMMRLTQEITGQMEPGTNDQASRIARSNEVGAMPSLHMALTVIVALTVAEFGRLWRYAGAAYATLMGLALVYLGEHYVIDEIAGVAVAVIVWRVCSQQVALPMWKNAPQAQPATARPIPPEDAPVGRTA